MALLGAAAYAPPCETQGTLRRPDAAPALTATANFSAGVAIAGDGVLELTLNRPLAPGEGELALVVGGTDVTAVTRRTPSRITYRPVAMQLSPGKTELVLFRRSGGRWSEIRRFPLAVRGVAQAVARGTSVDGSATLGNAGQLAEDHSEGATPPDRPSYQDFTFNSGLRTSSTWSGTSITTQSNYVGATRREQALRFGTLANRAPRLDLSGYLVTLQRGGASLSIGHVTFGQNRHLANGFAARGGTFTFADGATTVTLGALNSTAQIGWGNLVGLDRPADRVLGASIGRELLATHPGALRVDVTLVGGSKTPVSSFTQGAVTDAERSRGGSVQLSASVPNQRLRFSAGLTRSRFENTLDDPELVPDSIAFPRARPVTRGARFVELSADVLQQTPVPGIGPLSMTLGLHDERVDPLFGSIAAQPTADQQQDAVDATLTLGGMTAQLSQSWMRDNLANVPSVLTTHTTVTTANIALPVAALVGAQTRAAWFPIVTVALNRTRQLAANLPVNGDFRAQDLPDQMNLSGDAAAQWQIGRVHASLHLNRTRQDNRQDQRENSDFASGTSGLTFGTSVGTTGDVSADVGEDFQYSRERDEMTRVRRLTVTGTLPLVLGTQLVASVSAAHTRPPAGVAAFAGEQHVELSRAIRLWPGASGADRGQAFLRFGRTSALLPDPSAAPLPAEARVPIAQWTIASGFSIRVL